MKQQRDAEMPVAFFAGFGNATPQSSWTSDVQMPEQAGGRSAPARQTPQHPWPTPKAFCERARTDVLREELNGSRFSARLDGHTAELAGATTKSDGTRSECITRVHFLQVLKD